MKPFIDSAFWSDPDVEASKAGAKLAALWLITNSQTSLLGICGASTARFEFETGLKSEALESALQALPRAFKRFGSVVFVRNYVRHQFGTGTKLVRNNFFVALKSQFLSVKDDDLRGFILAEYPEFEQALTKPLEGLTKPKDRKGREGIEKEKEPEGSAEGDCDSVPPSDFPESLRDIAFGSRWQEWEIHCRDRGRPLTSVSRQAQLAECAAQGRDNAMKALIFSISSNRDYIGWEWMRDTENRKNGTPKPKPRASV